MNIVKYRNLNRLRIRKTIMAGCFDKFPDVLREALESGKVEFPRDIQWKYEDMVAYRAIEIDRTNDVNIITRGSFASHAEKYPIFKNCCISYYSCSCFLTRKDLENVKKLRDNLDNGKMKLAKGILKYKNGPIKIKEQNNHIDWFLFKEANPMDDFKLINDED